MKIEKLEATAPSHWAAYLINGDGSSLDGKEQKTANLFVSVCLSGNWPVACEDAGFMRAHDATQFGVLASDCQTYVSLAYV